MTTIATVTSTTTTVAAATATATEPPTATATATATLTALASVTDSPAEIKKETGNRDGTIADTKTITMAAARKAGTAYICDIFRVIASTLAASTTTATIATTATTIAATATITKSFKAKDGVSAAQKINKKSMNPSGRRRASYKVFSNRHCHHLPSATVYRGVRILGFSIEGFVLILCMILLSTSRLVTAHREYRARIQDNGELNDRQLENSPSAKLSSNNGSDCGGDNMVTSLGVNLINSNNNTAEIIVKEEYKNEKGVKLNKTQEKNEQKLKTANNNHQIDDVENNNDYDDKVDDDDDDGINNNEDDGGGGGGVGGSNTGTRNNAHKSSILSKSSATDDAAAAAGGGGSVGVGVGVGVGVTINIDTPSSSSSLSSSSSSSARSIISSLNRGDILQRQLRAKAKHDSLESIKMHILMRLKLTRLPNITSPIPVPYNILENFYKNYNSTRSRATWRRHGATKSNNRAQYTQKPLELSNNDYIINSSDHEYDGDGMTQMQSDDVLAYRGHNSNNNYYSLQGSKSQDYNDEIDYDDDDDDDVLSDSVMSHINSIYLFPEIPHIRHNRKTELLFFNIDNSHSDISRATMHLYLRGWEWVRENYPELLDGNVSEKGCRDTIVVSIHRAVRRSNATNITHNIKLLESRHKIPPGPGQWVQINVLSMFTNWIENQYGNDTQEIFVRGVESWMRPLIVTIDRAAKTPLTVHIEIGTKIKHRYKRSTSLDCQESDHEDRCCRYPLKVNFTTFGWHFVVAPTSFDAYFCNGECKVGYLEQYTHTHLTSLTASATPCCSPTKMSALSLLYFDESNKLVMSVIPNMSVEKCSCS